MEKTLNEALSGSEIKEIILQEITKRLEGDTTLGDDLAYAGFSTQFEIKIQYLRSLTKETLVWGVGGSSHEPIAAADVAASTKIDDKHTSAESPDIERQRHDLPIPVLMQTPSGMKRDKVRIERG